MPATRQDFDDGHLGGRSALDAIPHVWRRLDHGFHKPNLEREPIYANRVRKWRELAMPVYFCDPPHPWRRGTNENTNRLLRQYLHKNVDLFVFTHHDLDEIAEKLNHRPRGRSTGPHPPRGSRPRNAHCCGWLAGRRRG